MATDRELVNFSQEHELNTVLARHGKAQSKSRDALRAWQSVQRKTRQKSAKAR